MSPLSLRLFFFLNDPATTEIYPLSLHDALPISRDICPAPMPIAASSRTRRIAFDLTAPTAAQANRRSRHSASRSEEHTSELQSRLHLVCRLLLEKKNTTQPGNVKARPTTRSWTS